MPPSKGKKHHESKTPVTQQDFYLEALEREEQAERWVLSDLLKTFRYYKEALELYEKGLKAPESCDLDTYHILYNESRIHLKIYTEFANIDGHINILQYINLPDDLQYALSTDLLLPIQQIVERMESLYRNMPSRTTWDLELHLLICYLTLLESWDQIESDTPFIELTEKFNAIAMKSINTQLDELRSWQNGHQPQNDAPDHTEGGNNRSSNQDEYLTVLDQITVYTLCETLITCLKFLQTSKEYLIELKIAHPLGTEVNQVPQSSIEAWWNRTEHDYQQLLNLMGSWTTELEPEIFNCISTSQELQLLLFSLDGLNRMAANTEILEMTSLQPTDTKELLLTKIDSLNFAIQCYEASEISDYKHYWELTSQLNKLMTKTQTMLAQERNDIITRKVKSRDTELSGIVFVLCEVMTRISENELRRLRCKEMELAQENPAADKVEAVQRTMKILAKNAHTWLVNAMKIAQQNCGFGECVIDKLKRNYIYNAAANALQQLEHQLKNLE